MYSRTNTKLSQLSLQQVLRLCCLCGLSAYMLLPALGHAQDDEDKAAKVWVDSPVSLPAAPVTENLLRFYSNANQVFSLIPNRLALSPTAACVSHWFLAAKLGQRTSVMKAYVATVIKNVCLLLVVQMAVGQAHVAMNGIRFPTKA